MQDPVFLQQGGVAHQQRPPLHFGLCAAAGNGGECAAGQQGKMARLGGADNGLSERVLAALFAIFYLPFAVIFDLTKRYK